MKKIFRSKIAVAIAILLFLAPVVAQAQSYNRGYRYRPNSYGYYNDFFWRQHPHYYSGLNAPGSYYSYGSSNYSYGFGYGGYTPPFRRNINPYGVFPSPYEYPGLFPN